MDLKRYILFFLFLPGKIRRRIFGKYGFFLDIHQKKIKRLKNIYKGKRIFVIGNGPSLTIQDLEKLQGEITIASNKIYLCFPDTTWRPTIYCTEDSMAYKSHDDVNRHLSDHTVKMFARKPGMKTTDPNIIFFDLSMEKFFKRKRPPKFGTNAVSTLYWGSTVTYTCIQLAYFMGAREIFLVGVDFFYDVYQHQKNGDSVFISDGKKRNHFHPDYDKEGEKFYPPNIERHKLSFKAVLQFQKESDLHVYNATRGGCLELFERVNLDKLF